MKNNTMSMAAAAVVSLTFGFGGIVGAQCLAPGSWFPHSQTPQPNDNANFNSNCAFHQWSWQMFLWLTQKTGPNGELRFEQMPTPAELFSLDDGEKPMAFESLGPQVLKLTARVNKFGGANELNEINQAGSRGLLVAQDGRAVYFSQHINQVYYDFIETNQYYIPEKYAAAPATQDFPIGSLELKASWRIVDKDNPPAGLYVRMAEINKLTTNASGAVVVDPSQTETVAVTLAGLHVVGVVKDHPEFIWATFEQTNNAPLLPAGTPPDSSNPVSDKDWTFYAKNTAAKDCNVNNAGTPVLDEASQRLLPVTQVFLQEEFGGGDNENKANIKSLNESVQSQLADDSPWKNYYLGGAIWMLPNTLAPGSIPASDLRGSLAVSNATMETFTQAQSFQNHCFACHTSGVQFKGSDMLAAKNMNISHAMVDGYFANLQKQKAKAALETRKMLMRQLRAKIE